MPSLERGRGVDSGGCQTGTSEQARSDVVDKKPLRLAFERVGFLFVVWRHACHTRRWCQTEGGVDDGVKWLWPKNAGRGSKVVSKGPSVSRSSKSRVVAT